MTQDIRLATYLKEHGNIDPLTSWRVLGIYRLSACILRLRKSGWEIRTDRMPVKNKFDEDCVVANYVLEKAQND